MALAIGVIAGTKDVKLRRNDYGLSVLWREHAGGLVTGVSQQPQPKLSSCGASE